MPLLRLISLLRRKRKEYSQLVVLDRSIPTKKQFSCTRSTYDGLTNITCIGRIHKDNAIKVEIDDGVSEISTEIANKLESCK